MRLGLDRVVLDRRKRVARGRIRQVLRRPANRRLWHDYQLMLRHSEVAPQIHRPGQFWNTLQRSLARELASESLNGFKRSINTRFSGFSPDDPIYFDYAIRSVYRELLKADRFGLLGSLEEPSLGDPFTVPIDGRPMGIDRLQSLSEFYAMTDGLSELSSVNVILEVGSGYGRVADLVQHATAGGCCYCLADLPLPLAIAQNYLRALWPHARILAYGEAEAVGRLTRAALSEFDFVFLAPWELEHLDAASCDIAVNINSFQEMTPEQVRWYINEFERVSSSRIYLKEWFAFDNDADNVRITVEDMCPSSAWQRKWLRPSFPFPTWDEMLFERLKA